MEDNRRKPFQKSIFIKHLQSKAVTKHYENDYIKEEIERYLWKINKNLDINEACYMFIIVSHFMNNVKYQDFKSFLHICANRILNSGNRLKQNDSKSYLCLVTKSSKFKNWWNNLYGLENRNNKVRITLDCSK